MSSLLERYTKYFLVADEEQKKSLRSIYISIISNLFSWGPFEKKNFRNHFVYLAELSIFQIVLCLFYLNE